MIARLLPPEEWSRLDGKMPQVAPLLPPGDVQVVAVESDGEIVACATLFKATHWEGTWVSPEHRNGGVVRALLRGARGAAEKLGSVWVFTGANEPKMAATIKRLGGVPIEMETYLLPLGGV